MTLVDISILMFLSIIVVLKATFSDSPCLKKVEIKNDRRNNRR